MEKNTLLTSENIDALRLLVDLVLDSNPNDKSFLDMNGDLYDKFYELAKDPSIYPSEQLEELKKRLTRRTINQLNVENLAQQANDLNTGLIFLITKKEEEER